MISLDLVSLLTRPIKDNALFANHLRVGVVFFGWRTPNWWTWKTSRLTTAA